MTRIPDDDKTIILYDGVCTICNAFVKFIIKNDRNDRFRFASLQSSFAEKYIEKTDFKNESFNTVLLIEKGITFRKSTAAIKSIVGLGGVWKIFYPLLFIPAFIRDPIYMLVSNTRYAIFGKKDYCELPTENIKHKFIA